MVNISMADRNIPSETTNYDWQEQAYCRPLDPSIFFPMNEAAQQRAADICGACAVRSECLEYALITKQQYGVWGGTTERQRIKILKSTKQSTAM